MISLRTVMMIASAAALSASAAFAQPSPPPKAADKPPAAAPAKPADDKKDDSKDTKRIIVSDAEAQKFWAFFEKLANIVVANKNDCTKMAAGINAHVDQNQALLKAVHEAKSQNKDLPQSYKDKITQKFANEVAPALQLKCGNDKAVMDALTRIQA